MFTHKHYVPILKAKEGEFKALNETAATTKDSITPLMEVVDLPWDYDNDIEAKTIEDHLSKIGRKIQDNWGANRRIFVDSNQIDGRRKMSDGITHHLIHLFNDFRGKGLATIPTTGIERHMDYKSAVASIVSADKRGICLRLQNIDLSKPNLKAIIYADLTLYSVSPEETDLVIDIQSLIGADIALVALGIVTFTNTILPYLHEWRSLTVASSAFPTDLSDIAVGTISTIDRDDWNLWNLLLAAAIARLPSFGDYAIAHPESVDLDPRLMTISASIRYTCDKDWLILRGKSTKLLGWGQYHALCQTLISLGMPPYCGPTFSWGDKYISDCSNPSPTVGPGNATVWRKVATNHHLEKVVSQISSFP